MTSLVVGNNASAIDAGAGNASIFASLGANTLTVGGANTTTVFPGSLTVEGTTTFIDSTNLRVRTRSSILTPMLLERVLDPTLVRD